MYNYTMNKSLLLLAFQPYAHNHTIAHISILLGRSTFIYIDIYENKDIFILIL